jgi:predicted phage terminase large subunit-like protein
MTQHGRWGGQIPAAYSLLIEKKGAGVSLIQELQRENIYAVGIDPDGDKILRMEAQTARIEAGAVYLPRNAPWLDEFKKEVLSFPKGRHDDQVDALSQGLQRAFLPRPVGPIQGRWSRHPPRR